MSEGLGYLRDVPQKDHDTGESGDFFSYDRNEAEADADGGDAAARGGDGYNRGDVDINIGGGGDAAARGGDADADVRVHEEYHVYREYTEAPSYSHDEHSHDSHTSEEYPDSSGAEVY